MPQKVIKLSINDIENIVKKTIKEQTDATGKKRNISFGKDNDGKFYVIDVDTNEILGSK